jgi:hypothetical protein
MNARQFSEDKRNPRSGARRSRLKLQRDRERDARAVAQRFGDSVELAKLARADAWRAMREEGEED